MDQLLQSMHTFSTKELIYYLVGVSMLVLIFVAYRYGYARILWGKIMGKRRRKVFLNELAEDFITEGFEEAFEKGWITLQEKQMMYRKLGISYSLDGLLPSKDQGKLKEAIKHRLNSILHAPVKLPDEEGNNQVPEKSTLLSRLLAQKKAA